MRKGRPNRSVLEAYRASFESKSRVSGSLFRDVVDQMVATQLQLEEARSTLRDEFARAALAMIPPSLAAGGVANLAYQIADEMLARRLAE